jgi:hypothetical protein
VCRQIVHDNDILALKRWSQTLLDIGKERRSGHGAINDKWRRLRRLNSIVVVAPQRRAFVGDYSYIAGCKDFKIFWTPFNSTQEFRGVGSYAGAGISTRSAVEQSRGA